MQTNIQASQDNDNLTNSSTFSKAANDQKIIAIFTARIKDAYGDPQIFKYHGFNSHVLTVVNVAEKIADRVEGHGVSVNRLVLTLAALGHDALFGLKPSSFGFRNSEELAADYAVKICRELELPQEVIDGVRHAIEATNFAVQPRTVEARILRAADLSNLSGPYSEFRKCTEAFYEESLSRSGEKPFESFALQSLRYLSLYMADIIELTPQARDEMGRSSWHLAAMRNVIQLFKEARPQGVVHAYIGQGGDETFPIERAVDPSSRLVIDVMGDATLRNPANRLRLESTFSSPNIIMKIPGAQNAIPLPNASCEVVFLACPEAVSVNELARICTASGSILLRWKATDDLQELVAALSKIGFNIACGFTDKEGRIVTFTRGSAPLVY